MVQCAEEKSYYHRLYLPGCKTSGIERIPDALMRRFKWPYVSFISLAEAFKKLRVKIKSYSLMYLSINIPLLNILEQEIHALITWKAGKQGK